MTERRTRYRRPCPVPGCDWWQTTAWFVDGPDRTEYVPDAFLMMEAESHLVSSHYTPERLIIT